MTITGAGQWVRNLQNGSNANLAAFHGAKYFTQEPSVLGVLVNAGDPIPFGSTGNTYDVTLWDTDGYASGGGFTIPAGLGGLYVLTGSAQGTPEPLIYTFDGTHIDGLWEMDPIGMGSDIVYMREGSSWYLFCGTPPFSHVGFAVFSITYVCPLPASWTPP